MTLDLGYARLAEVLRSGESDFDRALAIAAEDVESRFPDDDADSLASLLRDTLFDRLETHASLSWEGHMIGSGAKILGSVALTPESVWMIKIEDMSEVEIYPLRGYSSIEAARDAVPSHLEGLFEGTGVPHEIDLGGVPEPRAWAWAFFMKRVDDPESLGLINWTDIARSVERFGLKTLPYETDIEREILLGEYLDIALS
ncbi:MAG: hypothetical protein U9R51_10195 [Actinomycetota bacterium]|nr:hypothetical protein [Actinomycetota bacterium]